MTATAGPEPARQPAHIAFRVHARRETFVMLASLFGLAACAEADPPPLAPLPDVAEVALDRAGDGPVEGTIAGTAFRAVDVRVRIVTMAGRERVDLFLADRAIERCGLPIAREGTRVWLRLPGRTTLPTGTYERLDDVASPVGDDAPDGALEVHYEVPSEEGFQTAHRAIGRVEITRSEGGTIEGRLRACFADEEHSCVGGHFVATPCVSRIDGRALREPPGLADEALEPHGAVETAEAHGAADAVEPPTAGEAPAAGEPHGGGGAPEPSPEGAP